MVSSLTPMNGAAPLNGQCRLTLIRLQMLSLLGDDGETGDTKRNINKFYMSVGPGYYGYLEWYYIYVRIRMIAHGCLHIAREQN